jgi:hypothetical protein
MLPFLKYIPTDGAKEMYVDSCLPLKSTISSEKFVQMLKLYNDDKYKERFMDQVKEYVIELSPSDFRQCIGLFSNENNKNTMFVSDMREKVKNIDVIELIKCLSLFTSDLGRFMFISKCSDKFAHIPGNMIAACLKTYTDDDNRKLFVPSVLNKITSINIDDYINCLKVHKTEAGKDIFVINAKGKLKIERLEFKGLQECFSKDSLYYYISLRNFIETYISNGKTITISELFKSIDDLSERDKFLIARDFSKNIIIDDATVIAQNIKNEKLATNLREHYNNI